MVGLRSRRLTWITAAVLGIISTVIIAFLGLFLPLQIEFSFWKPEEIFTGFIALHISRVELNLLLMVFLLHFSVIAYHPSKAFIKSSSRYILSGIVFFAIPVFLSANLLTLVIGLLLYDFFILLAFNPVINDTQVSADKRDNLLLSRVSGTMMLTAFVFLETHFTGNPVLEIVGVTLICFVILTRIFSTPYPNKLYRIEARPRSFEFFINAALSLFIIGKQFPGFGAAYTHIIVLLIGAMFFLLHIPWMRWISSTSEHLHGFTIALAGLTFISMYLQPMVAAESLLGSISLLLAGAGSVFLIPHFNKHHVPALVIFGALLLGFPVGSPASWQGVWAHLLQSGSTSVFIFLLPIFIGILVFSLFRYSGDMKRTARAEEMVELIFLQYVPFFSVFTIFIMGLIRPTTFLSWHAWLFTAMVCTIIGFSYVMRSRINSIRIPKILTASERLWSVFRHFVNAGSISLIRLTNELERFVEGKNSFLWIIFLISALALITRG